MWIRLMGEAFNMWAIYRPQQMSAAAGVQLHARGTGWLATLTGNTLCADIVNTFLLLIARLRYHGEEAG
jgi:hypothetical protein